MKLSVINTKAESQQRKLRVCAYVRVFSDKDAQMESLENQEAYFKRKYAEDDTCDFVGVFSDAGEIDLIHTKSISRFARNTVTVLEVSRELKLLGVGIYFEEQNINTLSAEGELMLTVLASFAQAEAFDMSENQKWAVRKKFARGEVMVNTNRFMGYDKDAEGNLIINEDEAKVVRMIFRLYLDGNGAHRIAKILNTSGITTVTGGHWYESTI